MSNTIRKELVVPQPQQQVWEALTTSEALADWMFPNDFQPRVGHNFTFRVPGNPKLNFDGLTVHCEVLECDAPRSLIFTWSAGGAVVDTRVSFRLEPEGAGTRIFFEHSGFNLAHPHGNQAFRGAGYGWANMLEKLRARLAGAAPRPD